MFRNICFLELSEEFPRNSKNVFETATINEPSVFEALRFYRTAHYGQETEHISVAHTRTVPITLTLKDPNSYLFCRMA